MHEYECEKCGETFIGDGAETEIHEFSNEKQMLCGGNGVLRYTYTFDANRELHRTEVKENEQ